MPSVLEIDSADHRLSSLSSLSGDRAPLVRKYGLLSQTISPGSQVRWILPARIRSRKHNDVVFVGETSIQLRECLPDGTLLDATAKLHIGSQITAAKVASAVLEKVPTIDAVLKQEWDEEQFLVKGDPVADGQPPQILILCTNACELIYLYAVDNTHKGVRFVYAKRSIIQGPSMLSKWGRHMAVDPESKLLAVASADVLSVFSLPEVDDLKATIDSWKASIPASFAPNKEQRFLPIDGFIIRMDFLRSPGDEKEKTFLLIVVAKNGQSKIVLYRWDSRESLVYMEPLKCSGRSMPIEDSFPLMLIPSTRPLSFWIVTETELAFYENIRSTQAKRISTPLSDESSTTDLQLWVQWAKPVRHNQYEKDKEEILLVREDGLMRYFSRSHNPPSDTVMAVTPGLLQIHVDTALCMLPGPRVRGGDILIVGGIDTDGGVFWLPPRNFPQMLQAIRNVSPLYDVTTVSEHKQDAQQIFSISGESHNSRVNELRFGLEAQSLATIPVDDCAAIDRLWAFEQELENCLYIVASTLERTIVIVQNLADSDDMQLLEDPSPCALVLSEATLAIEKLLSGTIVQITLSGINTISGPINGAAPNISDEVGTCVCGDVDQTSGLFAVACSASSGSRVVFGVVRESEGNSNIVMAPDFLHTDRPFSMRLVSIADSHLLALGYFDGSVRLYTISPANGVKLQTFVEGSGDRGVGISAIDVLYRRGQQFALIVTGTLDGRLNLSKLSLLEVEGVKSYSIELQGSYSMGLTRVFVTPARTAEHDLSSVFVSGERRLARVSLTGSESQSDFVFDEIWVTDRADMAAPQPPIRAITRVPQLKLNTQSEWSGNLIFGGPEELISTNLILQRQMIPLCYAKCGRARHISYSHFLRKLIVAADTTHLEHSGTETQPSLYLISPNLSNFRESPTPPVRFGKAREKVKALLNWSPSNGRTHYNLVIIALSDGCDSRIGHLSAKKLGVTSDEPTIFKVMMTLPRLDVYAICEFGPSSLIIAAGSQLILLQLEVEAKKWSQQARYDLPSAALSLSTKGRFVYAATSKHSMIVLKLEEQQFKSVFSDKAAKNVRHVVPFGSDGRHVLVSALNGVGSTIYGYMQGSSISGKPSPSFEIHTPLPVEQIIPIRTNWTSNDHYAFQASTIDGTIYQFKTLSADEYKMLHFLEKIAQSDIANPAKKQIALLTRKMAQTWVSKLEAGGVSTFDPKTMHVNGDAIERLLEDGTIDLGELLGSEIKSEDEMVLDNGKSRRARFQSLALRVVGSNTDQVGAVMSWMRSLLRSSII